MISSQTLVSCKRSASAAKLDGSAAVSSNKRQRVKKPTKKHTVQNGTYAAAKFSDSFSISHVVNLLVAGQFLILYTATGVDALPRGPPVDLLGRQAGGDFLIGFQFLREPSSPARPLARPPAVRAPSMGVHP